VASISKGGVSTAAFGTRQVLRTSVGRSAISVWKPCSRPLKTLQHDEISLLSG
jgi:hypothetical protein